MIDFIKIHYRDKSDFEPFMLMEGNFENVYKKVDYHTGEITYPYSTKYENMDYIVSQKTGCIKNSIHKFYNFSKYKQDQNFNDFTFSMLEESIDTLLEKMVNVEETRITQLEFGLNILLPIPAEEIIRKNILMHQYKGFNHNRKYYGKGELKQFDHSNYVVKIYDKAKQYRKEFNITENILRIELKFIKAREFQEAGIFNLIDLRDKMNLRRLFLILLKRFDELTIIDDLDNLGFHNDMDKAKLTAYLNPRYWEGFSEKKKYQQRLVKKADFERIQRLYNLNKTKSFIRTQLIQKFIYLLNN